MIIWLIRRNGQKALDLLESKSAGFDNKRCYDAWQNGFELCYAVKRIL